MLLSAIVELTVPLLPKFVSSLPYAHLCSNVGKN